MTRKLSESIFAAKATSKEQVPAIGMIQGLAPCKLSNVSSSFTLVLASFLLRPSSRVHWRFRDRELQPMRSESASSQVSPLLYEGSFDEWISKLKTLMRLGQWSRSHESTRSPSTKEAIHLIESHVQPGLLARLPEGCRNDTVQLLSALKRFAKPLRLMDLPAEIRGMVYDHDLRPTSYVTLFETIFNSGAELNTAAVRECMYESPPSFTRVSREIRKETMPLYF